MGAVLDSLHSVAQQAVEKVQTNSARGTRSTRSGRGNAEVEAAQKLAQGIVQWIDQVDQGAVESQVMEVVQEQNWPIPSPAAVVVNAEAPAVVPVPVETVAVSANKATAETVEANIAVPAVSTLVATAVASPGSPYVAPKRKIGDITPGSVTRSASKAKRATKESVEQIHAEPSVAESARKVQIKGLKDIKDALRIPPFVPSSSQKACAVNKTPSHATQASPRANTVRPAFLHALGGKNPAFPSLQSAEGGTTPSQAVSVGGTSNHNHTSSSSSNANGTSNNRRSPLKALPMSLQQQILNSAAYRNRQNSENGVNKSNNEQPVIDRAAKWMRPLQEESNSVRSAVERRLSAMRQVLIYLISQSCIFSFVFCARSVYIVNDGALMHWYTTLCLLA